MAEDEIDNAMVKAGAAVLSSADPTGGVATALVAHALTNMSVESAWRGAALDLWLEILVEEGDGRRKQYKETQEEFSRHRHILEWLTDELERALGRIAGLEAIALSLLAQGEAMVRLRPEPEMREFIAAALHNTLRRRETFTTTWVRRLTALLERLGAEHIQLLRKIAALSNGQNVVQTQAWWMQVMSDDEASGNELRSNNLVTYPQGYITSGGGANLGGGDDAVEVRRSRREAPEPR